MYRESGFIIEICMLFTYTIHIWLMGIQALEHSAGSANTLIFVGTFSVPCQQMWGGGGGITDAQSFLAPVK